MKASEIITSAEVSRKFLSHQQWHMLLIVCAAGEKGILFSNLAKARWTGREDSVKASVTKMWTAGLIDCRPHTRGGSRYRGTRHLTAKPKAFRLLGVEPETAS